MNDRELPPLPPAVAALLEAERRAPDPSAEARARVRSRVEVSVGLLAGGAATAATLGAVKAGAATPAAGALAVPAVAGTSLAIKVVVCALGAAALGGGSWAVVRARAKPPIAQPRVAAPTANARPGAANARPGAANARPGAAATQPLAPPAPPAVPPPIAPAPPRRAHPAAPEVVPSLAAEQTLVEQARGALRSGDVPRALTLLAQHERRYPEGLLAEARESLRVQALVAAGEPEAARARGLAFYQRFPRSLFRPAVDAALDSVK